MLNSNLVNMYNDLETGDKFLVLELDKAINQSHARYKVLGLVNCIQYYMSHNLSLLEFEKPKHLKILFSNLE